MEKGLTRKAELLRGGDVCIPEGLELPDLIPGFNGNPDTAVLSFDGFRAKKRIVHGNGEFELRPKDGGYELLRSGEPFLPEVGILRVPHSCPEQAAFNLLPSRHDCFSDGPLTTESVMKMLDEAMTRGKVKSVAFSGGGSDEEISRLADAISAVREAFPECSVARSSPFLVEIMAHNVDKVDAVEAMCARLGFDLKDAIAFGDNYNDERMLLRVGRGYLMGNAPEELSARMELHTDDNAHDGVANALARLGLID